MLMANGESLTNEKKTQLIIFQPLLPPTTLLYTEAELSPSRPYKLHFLILSGFMYFLDFKWFYVFSFPKHPIQRLKMTFNLIV